MCGRSQTIQRCQRGCSGSAGCTSSESSQAEPAQTSEDDLEVAYVKFLLGGSEAHKKAHEEENNQVRKMFEECRNNFAYGSEVWHADNCLPFPSRHFSHCWKSLHGDEKIVCVILRRVPLMVAA